MKSLKIGRYELYALAIIICAVLLRLLLLSLGWPPTNSDEGTMGIMARHIAFNGEHPVIFYGQNYMGTMEAYLGAIFFHLFGPSLFSLRLSVTLLFALFLTSMYLLTSLLYTKKLALAVLVLLSLGSNAMFLRELYATGGSTQTLLFGSLAFLLAAWLSLSSSPSPGTTNRERWLRLAGYTAWGLVVGLGLWSDMIVVPYFMMSALLLLLFCWRDLRTWAPLCLLLGFIAGALPLIAYNLQAPGQNSLTTILGLMHGSSVQAPHTLPQLLLGIRNTLQVSLPTATGDPSCPFPALKYAIDGSTHNFQCIVLHTGWGLGYLLLWAVAVYLAVRGLWRLKRNMAPSDITPAMSATTFRYGEEKRRAIVIHFARLFLLGSAGLNLVVYAASSAPLAIPQGHARYLVGLLIVTPAILWPLWNRSRVGARKVLSRVGIFGNGMRWDVVPVGAGVEVGGGGTLASPSSCSPGNRSPSRATQASPPLIPSTPAPTGLVPQKHASGPLTLLSTGLPLLIVIAFFIGTIGIVNEIPGTQTANQQQDALIHDLLHIGAKHIYTDYWTCDRIAFVSNEQIICGVLDSNLQPTHNRETRYLTIVSADPHSAYVFPLGNSALPTVEQKVAAGGGNTAFQRFVFDGYVVYQPI